MELQARSGELMPYITTCFYCQGSLEMRKSILVKSSLVSGIICRLHPECWDKMVADARAKQEEYNKLVEEMRHSRDEAWR